MSDPLNILFPRWRLAQALQDVVAMSLAASHPNRARESGHRRRPNHMGTERARSKDQSHGSEHEVHSVTELLDRIDDAAAAHEPTSVGHVMDHIGHRSYAPVLLLAGLVMMAPVVGDIPGVPVLMGLLVILTSGQQIVGRHHFWLPQWLLRRSVKHEKIQKGVRWMRPVGRFLDRWSKPRLTHLTRGAGVFVAAATCMVIAAATPVMEVVPFSANIAGIAITAYGLALIAADGVVALFAIAFSAGSFALIIRHLMQ